MKSSKQQEMNDNPGDDLAHKVLSDIKASSDLGLLRCVQCGLCTSMCPASKHSDYDAREIIKRVLDNDESIIEFKNVSFKYPDTTRVILKNVSFKINHPFI